MLLTSVINSVKYKIYFKLFKEEINVLTEYGKKIVDEIVNNPSFLKNHAKHLSSLPPHIRSIITDTTGLLRGRSLFHWHCGSRMYKFRFFRKLGGPYNIFVCGVCNFKIDKRHQ